ncbi:cyclic nucleotide-binding domain-containing protein, partial [candidate division KSB1 bacterium]
GDEMYIIKSGQIQIFKYAEGKKIELDVLDANEFFGEMALLSGRQRTASAMALKDSVLIAITNDMLKRQLRVVPPWFVKMLKTLVYRLEKADTMIC